MVNRDSQEDVAQTGSRKAADIQIQLRSILGKAARFSPKREFKAAKISSKFSESQPKLTNKTALPPEPSDPFPPPNPNAPRYEVRLDFRDRLVPGRKRTKIEAARARLETDHRSWLKKKEEALALWREQCEKLREAHEEQLKDHEQDLEQWESRKNEYQSKKRVHNRKLTSLVTNYAKSASRTEEYFRFCLERFLNKVPLNFPHSKRIPSLQLGLNSETKSIVVELRLPTPNDVPTLCQVKFIKTRNEMKEVHISERERDQLYDEILYQLAVGIVGVVFKSDTRKVVDQVVFNGWVRFRDEATGKLVESYIVSLQCDREEFSELRLGHVEAKACFQKLKGVGSGKLHGLVPVAPLLTLDTHDDRFIGSRAVAGQLEEGENLAAMDWGDFEHLVREVFESEFSREGGEVKITRASRDRGVDAIAFDPDPIRGGKIVIQAKRYTNLVGVDAVRDLYGTVVSEGANLGILVTTSNYGPDAYSFAKDKPLRLLNGSNLLHLLQKYGHRARIDLDEAKRLLAELERHS